MKSLIVAGSKPWNKNFIKKSIKIKNKMAFCLIAKELNKTLKKVINPLFLFFYIGIGKFQNHYKFECVCFI